MASLDFQLVQCPYCGESIEMTIDPSAGAQGYIEDCQVCCRPIEVSVRPDGPDWVLEVRRDDE